MIALFNEESAWPGIPSLRDKVPCRKQSTMDKLSQIKKAEKEEEESDAAYSSYC